MFYQGEQGIDKYCDKAGNYANCNILTELKSTFYKVFKDIAI